MQGFQRWPDIELLHNVNRSVKLFNDKNSKDAHISKVNYISKVKLDGTNAAVCVYGDGTIVAQSRNNIISVEDDNMGFAAWVEPHKESLRELASCLKSNMVLVFYGEWFGAKIQSSDLPGRYWAVYAMAISTDDEPKKTISVDPGVINNFLGVLGFRDDCFVLDIEHYITINYSNNLISHAVNEIETLVKEAELCDRFYNEYFDKVIPGEGYVYYPVDKDLLLINTSLMFKAKTQAHRVKKTPTAVEIDPVKLDNTQSFIDTFVTEQRLKQGVSEIGGYHTNYIGKYIAWVGRDIHKECQHELEANKLEWKELVKKVNKTARDWYMEQLASL
jgi:hypothetical protein